MTCILIGKEKYHNLLTVVNEGGRQEIKVDLNKENMRNIVYWFGLQRVILFEGKGR